MSVALVGERELAVANAASEIVTVYAAAASGNATPVATINVTSASPFIVAWVAF